jgi:hypothetical protein
MGALVVAMYIGQRKDFFVYEGPRCIRRCTASATASPALQPPPRRLATASPPHPFPGHITRSGIRRT